MQKMNKNGFNQCARVYIERLRKEGRYSAAHDAVGNIANENSCKDWPRCEICNGF